MPLGRAREPFSHPDWLFEVKWDGFRSHVRIEHRVCKLVSRNGNEFKSFAVLNEAIASELKAHSAVLDGEIDHNEIYFLRNPLDKVTIPASEEDHEEVKVLLPEQVIALLERLPYPVKFAVLLVASTGVRISECLAFRWSHVEWNENKIRIDQTFRRGEIQKRTKTLASKAPVPMCGALAAYLAEWRQQTLYNKDEDFIFASPKLNGKQPLWGQTMNADFVKPAALALGLVARGERFGWHRFRHSLSTWANEITKDITISQTLLRHSKPEMTAVYTHGNFDKALELQRKYMEQLLAAKPASVSAQ